MTKKILLAGVAVFVAWSVLDFIIHGVLLQPYYAASPGLFRPQAEMKMVLMYVAVIIAALAFAAAYGWFVSPKNLMTGLKYGLVVGFGAGVSMGYASYAVMPIPYMMALGWFLGSWVEFAVAGAIVGAIET